MKGWQPNTEFPDNLTWSTNARVWLRANAENHPIEMEYSCMMAPHKPAWAELEGKPDMRRYVSLFEDTLVYKHGASNNLTLEVITHIAMFVRQWRMTFGE